MGALTARGRDREEDVMTGGEIGGEGGVTGEEVGSSRGVVSGSSERSRELHQSISPFTVV